MKKGIKKGMLVNWDPKRRGEVDPATHEPKYHPSEDYGEGPFAVESVGV